MTSKVTRHKQISLERKRTGGGGLFFNVVGLGTAAAVLTIWCIVLLCCFVFLDEQDQILIDGMEKFCAALDVDPTDVVMLVMAWHLKAETMCEFTRAGFVQGWTELKYVLISVILSLMAVEYRSTNQAQLNLFTYCCHQF